MDLTISMFARAAGLSPKALRLYDQLGLLRPARVDAATGYRYYDPAQLDRARTVALLRRLGMPLARIRAVCDLPPEAAADEVAAYWAEVEADTAERRALAGLLADHLAEEARPRPRLTIRYAVRTDPGLVRPTNEDTAFADDRLLAVADGFGGTDALAAAAVDALRGEEIGGEALGGDGPVAGDVLTTLAEAAARVRDRVRDAASADPAHAAAGTTFTGLLRVGARLGLVHIGDSRAYLLRGDGLFRITHDHSYVQSLVDTGRITAAEADSHPRRAMLLRALGAEGAATPDVGLHEARVGDRYLLCTDGLTSVVPDAAVRRVLQDGRGDPDASAAALITLAHAAGAPDNVSCVIADIRAADDAGEGE